MAQTFIEDMGAVEYRANADGAQESFTFPDFQNIRRHEIERAATFSLFLSKLQGQQAQMSEAVNDPFTRITTGEHLQYLAVTRYLADAWDWMAGFDLNEINAQRARVGAGLPAGAEGIDPLPPGGLKGAAEA